MWRFCLPHSVATLRQRLFPSCILPPPLPLCTLQSSSHGVTRPLAHSWSWTQWCTGGWRSGSTEANKRGTPCDCTQDACGTIVCNVWGGIGVLHPRAAESRGPDKHGQVEPRQGEGMSFRARGGMTRFNKEFLILDTNMLELYRFVTPSNSKHYTYIAPSVCCSLLGYFCFFFLLLIDFFSFLIDIYLLLMRNPILRDHWY